MKNMYLIKVGLDGCMVILLLSIGMSAAIPTYIGLRILFTLSEIFEVLNKNNPF